MKLARIDIKNLVLSVIIPVYNERETIHDIIEAVSATPYRKEVVVVDDGSTDGTGDILSTMQQDGLKVIHMIKTRARALLSKQDFLMPLAIL